VFVKDRYDFDSKIKCKCEFISVNEHIQQMVSEKMKKTSQSEKSKFNKKQHSIEGSDLKHTNMNSHYLSTQISETLDELVKKEDRFLEYVLWKKDFEIDFKGLYDITSERSVSKCASAEDDSQANRLSTNDRNDSMNSEKQFDLIKVKVKSKKIARSSVDTKMRIKHDEIVQMYEALKAFSLNDFINSNSNVTLKRFSKENVFKIINFHDLSNGRNESVSSDKSKYNFRKLSERNDKYDMFKRKKCYIIIVAIIFFICFYAFVG